MSRELALECDYVREAKCAKKFQWVTHKMTMSWDFGVYSRPPPGGGEDVIHLCLEFNLCIISKVLLEATQMHLFGNGNNFLCVRHFCVCFSGNCWRITPSSTCLTWSTSWAASMSSPRHWCLVSLWTKPPTSHRSSGMRYVHHKHDTAHGAVYTCMASKAADAIRGAPTRGGRHFCSHIL